MKNWKILIFFGSVWLLNFAGFAQDTALKKAKYEVLKRCLEYLAVDSPKNPSRIVPNCPDCTTLEQCRKYDDNINNGGSFVDFANPENPPSSIITDLSSYKEQLINKLISNKPGRTDEAIFKLLQTNLESIIVAGPAAGGTGQKAKVEADKKAKEEAAKKAKIEADKKAKEDADKKAKEDADKKGSPLITYMLYLLSLINMALVGYFFFKSAKDRQENTGRWKDLSSRINVMEQNLQNFQENSPLKSLEAKINTLETTVDWLRKQTDSRNNGGDKLARERETSPYTAPSGGGFYLQPDPTPVLREPEKLKYALYADLGDGFSVSSLSNQISADSLFEIKITSPTVAKLSITQNESAQKMAFSDPYQYLRTTCMYSGDPSGRIRTNTPGELELVGNKWRIVTKAEISFYR